MQKIIKRLELIKAAISLEDSEIIVLQIKQIQQVEKPPAVQDILQSLKDLDYANAVQKITQFITDQTQLSLYEDVELSALKMELQGLEQQLAQVNAQRDDRAHSVAQFNAQYSQYLGERINEILYLRVQITVFLLNKLDKKSGKKIEAERKFREARKDYAEFNGDFVEQQQKPKCKDLNKQEEEKLKLAFRRASKLCHPDMVARELKERATEQFKILIDAYDQNNLEKVEEILLALKAGGFSTASEQVNDKEQLRHYIASMREGIRALRVEIDSIEHDETYQLIVLLDGDFSEFFATKSEQLNAELEFLREELAQSKSVESL